MRMLLPPVRERRQIDRLLADFFHRNRSTDFRRALAALARFYRLKAPRITWFEYLDWGKTAGRTYENGEIHLVHPENWKRGRKYNSERQWVSMIYHEMGHYILWTDAERKADTFAARMVRGLGARARLRMPMPVDALGESREVAFVARRRQRPKSSKRATPRARRG